VDNAFAAGARMPLTVRAPGHDDAQGAFIGGRGQRVTVRFAADAR
jgi:hypothetical protein